MKKLVAIICVLAWSGFWAFGYLALSAPAQASVEHLTGAMVLAAIGFLTGTFAYLKLRREIG
ncbi:MAG: hypothetical protein NWS99_10640 [Paracoccaceae bacterium]|nr:hypothetical protein [Paracoccaceae bacterium]